MGGRVRRALARCRHVTLALLHPPRKASSMPDLRIHREHQLGLEKARKIAWKWAEEAEK
jgi:hypothetical protein